MNKQLSIILPCYNVEKYIAECLDSLYTQDIPEEAYEVICVNDCSPDGTRNIILEYQKAHPNLILIDHEVNKKQGGARNTGLKAATGEYVWFVDPDDYVEYNVIKQLLKQLKEKELDILFFDYIRFNSKEKIKNVPKVNVPKEEVFDGKKIFNEYNFWDVTSLSWIRISKRIFLLNNQLYFYSDFYFEDVICGIRCFLYAHSVMYFPLLVYNYRDTPNSVMNSGLTGVKIASILKMALEYYKLSIENKQNNFLSTRFYDIAVYYIKSVKKQILYINTKERFIFNKYILKIDNISSLKEIKKPLVVAVAVHKTFKYSFYLSFPFLLLIKKMKYYYNQL